MRNLASKYFNDSFDLSHAAFISIVAHFIFFATQPFGIFDKPLVQEKKYKKIRLEVVKKPEVVRVPQKKLEVKRPVLRKKPVLQKPVVAPMNNPTRQIKSIPMQVNRPTVAPVINKAPENIEVRTSVSIQKSVLGFNRTKYSAKPKMVKNVSTNISVLEHSRTSRLTSSGVHAVFDRKAFQPRTQGDKVRKLSQGAGGYSALIDTRGAIDNSFEPKIRNVAVLSFDNQDQLSDEELNDLWNGYTTTVRKMIARAKIYPTGAREKGQQGKIDLSFKLGKNGGVLKLLVEHSSGHAMLDEAARDAVNNAGPFPPIPEKLNKQYVLLKLPVSFILR